MEQGPLTVDVIDAIYTTGAQRRLKPDPIPESVIWAVLDAAIHGPSGGNSQRWAWVVITDPDTKRLVGEWYLDAWNSLGLGRRAKVQKVIHRLTGPAHGDAGPTEHHKGDCNYRSGEYLAHHIAEAPVWIFAVVNGIHGTPSVVDGADIFGAVQNLMLAARKYGLGTTLTMLHRKQEAKLDALLGLPRDAQALALIPLGYPMSGEFYVTRRQPVDAVTYWERWGEQRARVNGGSSATN